MSTPFPHAVSAPPGGIIPHQLESLAEEVAALRRQVAILSRLSPIRLIAFRLAEARNLADRLALMLNDLEEQASGMQAVRIFQTIDGAVMMLESQAEVVRAILGEEGFVTPTARTLAHLRKLGYVAAVVERWNMHAKIRQDLFGFIDLVAIRPGEPILAVQVTSRSNQAARMTKALAIPALRTWLAAGGAFEVHGWAKVGVRGKRKLWEVTRRAAPFNRAAVEEER